MLAGTSILSEVTHIVHMQYRGECLGPEQEDSGSFHSASSDLYRAYAVQGQQTS